MRASEYNANQALAGARPAPAPGARARRPRPAPAPGARARARAPMDHHAARHAAPVPFLQRPAHPKGKLQMRLVHLQANNAWAFLFGDQLIRLGDNGMLLFPAHHDAVLEARHFGFNVSRDGTVTLKENCK